MHSAKRQNIHGTTDAAGLLEDNQPPTTEIPCGKTLSRCMKALTLVLLKPHLSYQRTFYPFQATTSRDGQNHTLDILRGGGG